MKRKCRREHRLRRIKRMLIWSGLMTALLLVTSCRSKESPRAAYVPVSQLEQTYGQLISVANAATPYQNGTGDLLGLFRDDSGTVWGIPLSVSGVGTLLGCAPPMLHEAPVSDTLPAAVIVGAANEPTGWRGGTGKLGLMLRDAQGKLHWQLVAPIEIMSGPVCWSQSEPLQVLKNYRLVKAVIKD